MKPPVIYADGYALAWPGHVFPVGKYRAVAAALRGAGLVTGLLEPVPATREQVLAVHQPEYLLKLEAIADGRARWDPRFECPVDRAVLDAFLLQAGGTILAARSAVRAGRAANLGGGFHHAFADHGEGFCLLNDVVIATRVLLDEGLVPTVAVVDLDVHQGNGTAVMTAGDERVFTLSLHQENNYPLKEESSLDVGLRDLCDDGEYLSALEWALKATAERFKPGFVFYLAGADAFAKDRLGGLALSHEGLRERDRMVFRWAFEQAAPVAALLAGGYAEDEDDVTRIHVAMIEELLTPPEN
jgi:acetoin utilization deacetylase AcuC-like enzyme